MATINYISGNINVSMFPANASSLWICDKNTGGINIATNGAPMTANTIQLGNVNTSTIVSGTLKANTIQGIDATGNQSLYATKTGGILSIATTQTSGSINIGAAGSMTTLASTNIAIGSSGLPAAGYVSIAGGTNVETSYAVLGSSTLPYNYIRAQNIEINTETGTSGNISIGTNNSTTYIRGTLNLTSVAGDSDRTIQFQRNGQFTMGITATAKPKLILGVATGGGNVGNEVQIVSLGTNGSVYSNGQVLTNTNPSDKTLKKNITSLDASIDDLNPVQYEWNNPRMGVGIKYGFLANEVIEIFPNICSTWKTDEEDEEDRIPKVKLGMDTVSLIPIIVSAMKKMKLNYDAKLQYQDAKLQSQDAKLQEMKSNHQLLETKQEALQSNYEALLARIVALE